MHEHAFDPVSGWCAFCTIRDDGRHLWLGTPVRPVTIQQQETQDA